MAEYQTYLDGFQKPSAEFRPVTMWFWNDDLRKEEITFQLEQFKQQGVCEVFVNAVWGINVDYLSDEYFAYVQHAVAECKRLGLKYWIYDEFNWPSGNAGGKLQEKYPWAVGKILKCESIDCWAGNPANVLSPGELVAAYAVFDTGEEYRVVDIRQDLRVERLGEDTRITYSSPFNGMAKIQYYFSMPDPHVLTTCVWSEYAGYQPGYIDTFNRAAVDKFLELTHERYKAFVGEEFGKTVMGVFTDEICLASPFSIGENKLPWSVHFAPQFRERNGYDLTEHLYALFNPPRTQRDRQIRDDYFNTAKALYLENFVRPMYDWCDRNGLAFTGHFDGEESVVWHLMQSADLLTSMEYMHVPGIDSILSAQKIDDTNYNVAGKILNSAAKFYGRQRTLCETYTGSGWDLRFPLMKRIANRLAVLGVNKLHYMGAYYSWDGFAKTPPTSYPPTHSYNNPLWRYYGEFGDSVARVQYLSSVTKGASKVLCMVPLVQAKMDLDLSENIFDYKADTYCLRPLDELLEATVNGMLALNIDLDLVSEDAAQEMQAGDGVLTFRGERYDYLILPGMHFVSRQTAQLLGRLRAAGVKLLFLNTLPGQTVGAAAEGDAADLLPVYPAPQLLAENGTAALYTFPEEQAALLRVKAQPFDSAAYREILRQAFRREDVILGLQTTGNVFAGHRVNPDIEVFILANDDAHANEARIPANIPGLVFYDPETGEPKPVYTEGEQTVIPLVGYELTVGILDRYGAECPAVPAAAADAAVCSTVPTEDWTFAPRSGNLLGCRYEYLDGERWVPVQGGSFPRGVMTRPGQTYALRWRFVNEDVAGPVSLQLEVKYVRALRVNGQPVPFAVNTRFWGVNNFTTEITQLLRAGENVIEVDGQLPDWVGIHALPFAFLRGDFLVRPGTDADTVTTVHTRAVRPGSLLEQGYRYFIGDGVYRSTFTAARGENIRVNFDTPDAARLCVNGREVCTRLWQPLSVEIDEFLTDGENSIELELTVPGANLLGEPVDFGLYRLELLRSSAENSR